MLQYMKFVLMYVVGRETCLDLAVQVHFCHSNHFFPMSQWCFCVSLVKIHQLVQEIRVQTRLISTVCIVWWLWKLGLLIIRVTHKSTVAQMRSLISTFVVHRLDSIISLDSRNFKTLASFCGCTDRFVSGLVGNSRRHVLSCRGWFL